MWETSFDPSVLGGTDEIAIWCLSEDDANELLEILASIGAKWASGESLRAITKWYTYGVETVYFVDRSMEVTYCNREYATDHGFKADVCFRFNSRSTEMQLVDVEDLL